MLLLQRKPALSQLIFRRPLEAAGRWVAALPRVWNSAAARPSPRPRAFPMPPPGSFLATAVAVSLMVGALALIPLAETSALPVRRVLDTLPLKEPFAALTQLVSPVFLLSIAAVVWLLDSRRRLAVAYLLVALALSGLLVEPLKQIFGRARPEAGILMTEHYESRLERLALRHAAVPAPSEGLRQDLWLLGEEDRPYFVDAFASFPSGHATSAGILAAFLTALYAPGRVLWLLLAAGCALARVRARRHFLEDVLFSGGFGWLLATWVFRWDWPGRVARWATQFPRTKPQP